MSIPHKTRDIYNKIIEDFDMDVFKNNDHLEIIAILRIDDYDHYRFHLLSNGDDFKNDKTLSIRNWKNTVAMSQLHRPVQLSVCLNLKLFCITSRNPKLTIYYDLFKYGKQYSIRPRKLEPSTERIAMFQNQIRMLKLGK